MIRAFRNRLRGGEGEDGAAPVVSIVLPVCNGMPLLRQAIRSVLRQRFRDCELIVVDRGSTDGTLGYLARVRDPRVRAIHDAGDLGLPEALSRGLAAARGEYAAWTSHDDFLERDFLDVWPNLKTRARCQQAARAVATPETLSSRAMTTP